MELPADILTAAETALDNMLCNCSESCGGYDGMRRASIEDIARALLSERLSATERAAKIADPRIHHAKGKASTDMRKPADIAREIRSQP